MQPTQKKDSTQPMAHLYPHRTTRDSSDAAHRETVAVGLGTLLNDPYSKNWAMFCAGAIIAATPIVALFMGLQRYIVSGLTGGAVKIVDRMEFSRANFSADILKGWQR